MKDGEVVLEETDFAGSGAQGTDEDYPNGATLFNMYDLTVSSRSI